ncbi:hypothetical protein BJ912DRAFT_952820 [Pholiota molesta]|nr:hypothetical protein BJ912DRAFT_952820 [Pholiota molesta]
MLIALGTWPRASVFSYSRMYTLRRLALWHIVFVSMLVPQPTLLPLLSYRISFGTLGKRRVRHLGGGRQHPGSMSQGHGYATGISSVTKQSTGEMYYLRIKTAHFSVSTRSVG